jgi:hypothetical protein
MLEAVSGTGTREQALPGPVTQAALRKLLRDVPLFLAALDGASLALGNGLGFHRCCPL